jgi:hypothetical protein
VASSAENGEWGAAVVEKAGEEWCMGKGERSGPAPLGVQGAQVGSIQSQRSKNHAVDSVAARYPA